jgi:prophage regulatory protein
METPPRNQPQSEATLLSSTAVDAGIAIDANKIRILRLPDVISRVGLKRASIYQYITRGAFPRPVSLGARAVGWIEHEIDAWLFERIQASRTRNSDS